VILWLHFAVAGVGGTLPADTGNSRHEIRGDLHAASVAPPTSQGRSSGRDHGACRGLRATGGGNYVDQCGHAIGTDGDVTIDGGTFYNMGPVYDEYGYTDGGAVLNSGQLTVIGATFDGNITDDPGGAIYNEGQLTVVATRFTHNRVVAVQGSGGAIFNSNLGTLTVTSSTFSTNFGEGAAISNAGQVTLRQDTLSGNTASDGGAIYNDAALTAISASITRNTAAAGSPGGIDNDGGTVTLHHARILSNTSFNCSSVTGCTG
jgi:Right handed beta helix region